MGKRPEQGGKAVSSETLNALLALGGFVIGSMLGIWGGLKIAIYVQQQSSERESE